MNSRGQMRKELFDAVRRWAYNFKPEGFTLKSGRTSKHYVDCRRVLLDPTLLKMAARTLAHAIDDRHDSLDAIAGVVVGASSFAVALAGEMDLHAAWVRPQAKDHGTKKLVEVSGPFQSLIDLRRQRGESARCILLEDVTTTGQSALDAALALREAGIVVVSVWTLVDREEGAASMLEEHGLPLHHLFTLEELHGGADS